MERQAFGDPSLPPPAGTYSAAIKAGAFVFLAGQTPRDRDNVRHGDKPFDFQVRMTLDNLEGAARACGLSLKDAVKVGVFLQDPARAKEFDAIYASYVGSPPPARTLVQSDLPGFAIEVDAILLDATARG
jgi:enamine deaminase RidA (YjgF/YER057c/UK114 family)